VPGLLRGVARTAVIAGTASAVNGRVARRQAERFADRDAQIYANRAQAYSRGVQQAPAAAPPQEDPVIARLRQLAELKQQGVLTDEEFAAQKARILSG
jgi:hypothetical protein